MTAAVFLAGSAGAQTKHPEEVWTEGGDGWVPPVVVTPLPAIEPPARAFGEAGEIVVTTSSGAGVTSTFWETEASAFAAGFSSGLDIFVARNIALGAGFGVSHGERRGYGSDGDLVDQRVTAFSAGLYTRFNVPLGGDFSWYPGAGFGVEWTRLDLERVPDATFAPPPLVDPHTRHIGPWVSVFAPVLWHVRSHLFLGLGPSFFRGFGRAHREPEAGGERTSYGAGFMLGGWWGGRAPKNDRDAYVEPEGDDDTPRRPHRFGESGQLVISGDFDLYATWRSYAEGDNSSREYELGPALDYFVTSRVSLGFGLSFSGFSHTAVDPSTGEHATNEGSNAGGALRFGFDVPIASWLSFNPKGSIGFESSEYEAGAAPNSQTAVSITTALRAPLLAHVAPHAFLGFGPFVTHNLVRSVKFVAGGSVGNRGTAIGASTVVGGWID